MGSEISLGYNITQVYTISTKIQPVVGTILLPWAGCILLLVGDPNKGPSDHGPCVVRFSANGQNFELSQTDQPNELLQELRMERTGQRWGPLVS